MSNTEVPRDIQANRPQQALDITWPRGSVTKADFHALRCACTCAQCVHEVTGEQLLDPSQVPADITIEKMRLVGNYAMQITWSDGHDTGIYTWQRLREVSR